MKAKQQFADLQPVVVVQFLLPFDHYEQQLNASIIEREGLGVAASTVTVSNLSAFLGQLMTYRQNRLDSTEIYSRFDGDTVFLELIEAMPATVKVTFDAETLRELARLKQEASELTAIMVSSKKTARGNDAR